MRSRRHSTQTLASYILLRISRSRWAALSLNQSLAPTSQKKLFFPWFKDSNRQHSANLSASMNRYGSLSRHFVQMWVICRLQRYQMTVKQGLSESSKNNKGILKIVCYPLAVYWSTVPGSVGCRVTIWIMTDYNGRWWSGFEAQFR